MKKKIVALLMMAVLAASLTTAAAASSALADDDREVIELVMQSHDSTSANGTAFYTQWCEDILKASDGKLKITLYAGGVLGGQKDTYNMILNHSCDLGWCSQNSQQGAFPMSEVLTLPLMGIESVAQGSRILWHMYNDTDLMQKEYEPFHVIGLHCYCDVPIGFKDADVALDSIADLKGKNMRTSGTWPSALVTAIGANPVTIAANEIYSSLEKGVIDGTLCDWHLLKSISLVDQLKTVYDAKLYYGCAYVCMNKEVWEGLPDWAQKILNEYGGEYIVEGASAAWDEARENGINVLKEAGNTFAEPSEKFQEEIQEIADTLHQQWIDTNEEAGLPAQEVYDWVHDHLEEYK